MSSPPGRLWYRRAAGAGLFAASGTGWLVLVASLPSRYWRQADAVIYRDAGLAVRHSAGTLYAQEFGSAHLPFTYPPFAGVVFAVLSPLSFAAWQAILAAAGLGSLVLAAHASLRLAARGAPGGTGTVRAGTGTVRAGRPPAGAEPGGNSADRNRRSAAPWSARPDRLAGAFVIAAFALWLEPVDMTLHFGQINLILLALVLVDLAAPDSSRWKGVGLGVAAGLKLTPLIFIPYLLLTRRSRAAGLASATFAGTVAVGFAVLGRDSVSYWGGQFDRPGDRPFRLVNQSLNGFLLRLLRDRPAAHTAWLITALAVGVIGIVAAAAAARRGRELLGVCLCAATALLVSPISWSHHWVYVVPVIVLVIHGRVRRTARVLALAAVLALFAWWPTRTGGHGGLDPATRLHPSGLLRLAPHEDGTELRWSGWQLVYGDSYVAAATAFVLGAAFVYAAAGARSLRADRRGSASVATDGPGGRDAPVGLDAVGTERP